METAERVILTETTLAQAVDELAGHDPVLDTIVARFGRPPLWAGAGLSHAGPHHPGAAGLAGVGAGRVDRLAAAVTPLTPAGFLTLDDAQLKTVGFSRQKTRYGRELAAALLNGRLDLDALADLDDDGVRSELKKIAGIGDWTVDIYLLMALRRADAFPRSDLALQVAAQRVLGLAARPGPDALLALAEGWRPYRAAAARLLWHAYLSEKR